MVKVHRHSDGTVDVLFSSPDVQVAIVGATPDVWADEYETHSSDAQDAPAAPAAPAAEDDAEEAPASAADAATEDGVPSAEPTPFKCPQCGQFFTAPATCAKNHPPAETVDLGTATGAQAPKVGKGKIAGKGKGKTAGKGKGKTAGKAKAAGADKPQG